MKELRDVENFGATSGDLKMVKVRRGKRQSRSLVFRISRTSKPTSDEETSTVGEQNPSPLRVRIPRHVLQEKVPPDCQLDAPSRNENILGPNSRILNEGLKEIVVEPRRSSRLSVYKNGQPNYSMKESPKSSNTISFDPSKRSEQQGTECTKKRKRGRPPKLPPTFPKQLSLVKREGVGSEKVVLLAPPRNSVWTLVPKKLFESDHFRSQVLHVRGSSDSKPTFVEKDRKRPTVIYFKKEPSKLLLPNRVSKAENDMLYLFNKYRMFKDIILKNYYELAGGNVKETENMLSSFLSKNSDVFRIKKAASEQSVFDLHSASPASNPPLSGSETPPFRDTLSRQIIVESLQILYSDEAILG